MFEHLQIHSRIAVTGPQRSGTTIAAQMIALDTGYRHVDEREFGVYDVGKWEELLWSNEALVVQCPHMLKDLVDRQPRDVHVILMRRSMEEIRASEDRIGWHRSGAEVAELRRFGLDTGHPAAVKYEYWDKAQGVPNGSELEYTSLTRHQLWVDADARKHFRPKQTAIRPLR